MGLFKNLVEFGTKWKLVDKHGWGAGLLYEDEVNKRKQEENGKYGYTTNNSYNYLYSC